MHQRTELTLLSSIALALALAGCGGGGGKPAAPPPSTHSSLLGKPAPEFRRPAMGGESVTIASSKGKVVVVKFFAKYCEPCKRTLPAIEKLHKDRADIVIIGVAEDEHEAEAREVVQTYGLSFPVVHDASNVLAASSGLAASSEPASASPPQPAPVHATTTRPHATKARRFTMGRAV